MPTAMACSVLIRYRAIFAGAPAPASESPLLYKRVQSLHVDHMGAVWAGTGNGLYRYDVETGASTYYSERDGLPSNTVSCVFEDGFGELWMGTSEGLSRLDRSRRTFKNYSPADGLPGLDFTGLSACFRGASGEMFFGGFAGAVAFRPENVRDAEYAPPLAFTGFQLVWCSGRTRRGLAVVPRNRLHAGHRPVTSSEQPVDRVHHPQLSQSLDKPLPLSPRGTRGQMAGSRQ